MNIMIYKWEDGSDCYWLFLRSYCQWTVSRSWSWQLTIASGIVVFGITKCFHLIHDGGDAFRGLNGNNTFLCIWKSRLPLLFILSRLLFVPFDSLPYFIATINRFSHYFIGLLQIQSNDILTFEVCSFSTKDLWLVLIPSVAIHEVFYCAEIIHFKHRSYFGPSFY